MIFNYRDAALEVAAGAVALETGAALEAAGAAAAALEVAVAARNSVPGRATIWFPSTACQ